MLLMPLTRSRLAQPHALRSIDRLFDDTLDHLLARQPEPSRPASRAPAVDIRENATAYVITADLPGVAKDQVRIDVDGRTVSLEAQVPSATQREGERLIYSERSATRYARRLTLPTEVNESGATASLDNGVLTLTLPKRVASGPVQVSVN